MIVLSRTLTVSVHVGETPRRLRIGRSLAADAIGAFQLRLHRIASCTNTAQKLGGRSAPRSEVYFLFAFSTLETHWSVIQSIVDKVRRGPATIEFMESPADSDHFGALRLLFIGLMIAGQRLSEARVLALAYAYERATEGIPVSRPSPPIRPFLRSPSPTKMRY